MHVPFIGFSLFFNQCLEDPQTRSFLFQPLLTMLSWGTTFPHQCSHVTRFDKDAQGLRLLAVQNQRKLPRPHQWEGSASKQQAQALLQTTCQTCRLLRKAIRWKYTSVVGQLSPAFNILRKTPKKLSGRNLRKWMKMARYCS